MLKEGIVIGGRYEIISRVGSGGMADVYKARDHKLDRMVAVKVLKAEFREDKSFIAKFRKEAQSAAGLSHPNVVNVFDVGEDRGLYYIVMELIEGITLKDYITKKGKLSVKEATSIAIQVSLGLEAAHDRGIIHRDVKPQNIIISTDGKVKLSDFGIAKATNSNTITANVMGSVHYSSPEQVRGGISDAKSDIYSLGVTMYEMVTGRVPFDGDTTVAIAIKHLQEEMVPPSRYTPDLPYSLEQIILKCTQKNPERRYGNMGLLIEDLKHSLIDPQGNFVTLTPLSSHAQTVMMSEGEMQAIRAAAGGQGRQSAPSQSTSRNTGSRTSRYEDPEDAEDADDYRRRSGDDDEEDDDDEVSSKLEKAITIGGFLIGAVIIIILIVVIGNMAGLFNRKTSKKTETPSSSSSVSTSSSTESDQVSVPDFRGKTLAEAQELASQLNIGVKQTGTQASTDYAEGQVVSQSVDPETRVDKYTTIELVISSGQGNVTIPTGLVGATQTEAEAVLAGLGLTSNPVLQNDDNVEAGRVISLDPGEGSTALPGTQVTLYISKGPQESDTLYVPTLRGQSEADAKALLDSMGLTYTTTTDSSSEVNTGEVISTSPGAGESVAPGTTITLTINAGNSGSGTDTSSWVCYSPLAEPEAYQGGSVRLTLEQNGTETTFYEGANPWGDNNVYNQPIYGAAGVSNGVIKVYEDGVLIAQYSNVTFEAP